MFCVQGFLLKTSQQQIVQFSWSIRGEVQAITGNIWAILLGIHSVGLKTIQLRKITEPISARVFRVTGLILHHEDLFRHFIRNIRNQQTYQQTYPMLLTKQEPIKFTGQHSW